MNDLLLVEDTNVDKRIRYPIHLHSSSDKLKEGDFLRIVLYTTDFEIIIRDNTAYHPTDDFVPSTLSVPSTRSNIL